MGVHCHCCGGAGHYQNVCPLPPKEEEKKAFAAAAHKVSDKSDSEEEDDKPLAKKRAPKRDSSPPVEADTSFDWDGAAEEMDAKGML